MLTAIRKMIMIKEVEAIGVSARDRPRPDRPDECSMAREGERWVLGGRTWHDSTARILLAREVVG
jgi:hypothetical protein